MLRHTLALAVGLVAILISIGTADSHTASASSFAPGGGLEDRFRTLEPGSRLPSGSACASRVRRSDWEPRPENRTANSLAGGSVDRIDGASDSVSMRYASRIDGNFSGTTDEIIQWGACKWGFDEDVVRAVAVQESWWRQSTLGDPDGSDYQSFGLLQVKRTVHRGTFPYSARSTAFNVDYALAWRRACYEGDFGWLNQGDASNGYRSGDEWGCIGAWFSGRWMNPAALGYIFQVKQHLARRTWLSPGF